ncbi:hypothetical protein D3C81_2050780 [compost metagenome]
MERGKLIKQMLAVRISPDNEEAAAFLADHPGQTLANQDFIIYNHNTQQSGVPLSCLVLVLILLAGEIFDS